MKTGWERLASTIALIALLAANLLAAVPASAQSGGPADLVARGDQHLLASRFHDAEQAYNDALQADPDYAPAYAHRCYLRTFQTRLDEARSDCLRAIELARSEAEGYLYLTRLQIRSGNLDQAIDAGLRAVDLEPGNGLAHSFLGEAYLAAEKAAKAETEMQKALDLAPDSAEVHRNFALLLGQDSAQGQYDELVIALQLAPEFVFYHVEAADLLMSGGQFEEAYEFYKLAWPLLTQAEDIPGLQRHVVNYLAMTTLMTGHYQESIEPLLASLDIARQLGDVQDELGILDTIAFAYQYLGEHEKAIDYYDQTLALARREGDSAGEVSALHAMGEVYGYMGDYAAAHEVLQQALDLARQTGDRTQEQGVLHDIATTYFNQGRLGEALENYQHALTIARQLENKLEEGNALNRIGGVYFELGQYDQAVAHHQQAIAIHKAAGQAVWEAKAINGLANAYAEQGRLDEALAAYESALEIFRQLENARDEAVVLSNIGTIYLQQGIGLEDEAAKVEAYQKAVDAHLQAVQVFRELRDPANEAIALGTLSLIYGYLRRVDEAQEAFDQAEALSAELGDPTGLAVVYYNYGTVQEHTGNAELALDSYERAMEAVEQVRATAGGEISRASFMSRFISVFDSAVQLYFDEGLYGGAFLAAERGRARAFLDSLATGQVQLSDEEAAQLLAREGEAYAAREDARDALNQAHALQPPDPSLVETRQADLAQAEADYAAILSEIEARADQLGDLVPGRSSVLGAEAAQALLDDQTTIAAYYLTSERGMVFILSAEGFNAIELPVGGEQIEQEVTQFRSLGLANLEVEHPASLRKLHEWLIEPLLPHLHTPYLGIVPHRSLHYVPFAALTDGETYLGEEYNLFTLPSVSSLEFLSQAASSQQGSLLALGNPASSLPDLQYAEEEVTAIAGLFGVQPVVGGQATESIVRSQAGQTGILHLAAHGTYDPLHPLYSAIHLAADAGNDGLLEAQEIYGLDLAAIADLVVLSACETQIGQLTAGDEVVGLTRAFLFAGAPTVIASLWSVDDEATALLMSQFYTHLQAGEGKAEALRAAQLAVRSEFPHPYYWAAFVLTGDPGAITQPAEGPPDTEPAEGGESKPGFKLPFCPSSVLLASSVMIMAAARGRCRSRRQ